jgi:hypothetical protein
LLRQSHVGKTLAERRLYIETVIRAKAAPTLEDKPIIDTTDRTAVSEKTETPPYHPTKPPSAIGRFLREKAVELVASVIIVGLLVWGARQLYILSWIELP